MSFSFLKRSFLWKKCLNAYLGSFLGPQESFFLFLWSFLFLDEKGFHNSCERSKFFQSLWKAFFRCFYIYDMFLHNTFLSLSFLFFFQENSIFPSGNIFRNFIKRVFLKIFVKSIFGLLVFRICHLCLFLYSDFFFSQILWSIFGFVFGF